MSTVNSLNTMLAKMKVTGPVQKLLHQSGVRMNVAIYLLGTGCLGVGAFWLTLISSRLMFLAVVAGLLSVRFRTCSSATTRAKRLRKFEEQFPEAIDLVARALRAGHALPDRPGHGGRRTLGAGRHGVPHSVR
jgi:tight adherence protein B